MPEKYRFLLVGDTDDDPWRQIIEEASRDLGSLDTVNEMETDCLIKQLDYDLIIIDAARVRNAFSLVSSIRDQRPGSRIVVATASPTWRRAREAFRVGATDYFRKSMNSKQIKSVLYTTLSKTPPR